MVACCAYRVALGRARRQAPGAGVAARCRQVMGTIHGTEIFSITCPDISRDTASDLANFCRD